MASWSDHCPNCSAGDRDAAGELKHEAWCPLFMRGPDAGGDPAEWGRLFEEQPAPDPICEWCGGAEAVGTCPRSITCPRCSSPAGAPCYRPSGHRAPVLHAERIAAAEELERA